MPADEEGAGRTGHGDDGEERPESEASELGQHKREPARQKHAGDDTKIINLIKSIEKTAEEDSGDPFLVAMSDRAKQIQESYEDRQTSTQEASFTSMQGSAMT